MIRSEEIVIGSKEELIEYFRKIVGVVTREEEENVWLQPIYHRDIGSFTIEHQLDNFNKKDPKFGKVFYLKNEHVGYEKIPTDISGDDNSAIEHRKYTIISKFIYLIDRAEKYEKTTD